MFIALGSGFLIKLLLERHVRTATIKGKIRMSLLTELICVASAWAIDMAHLRGCQIIVTTRWMRNLKAGIRKNVDPKS